MKKAVLIVMMLCFGATFAQDKEKKVKLEQKGDLVEATYYYDNGQIEQHGFFKDEELQGNWVYYSKEGLKISMGTYEAGKKTGKWYFWNNGNPKNISYVNGKVNKATKNL